MTGFSGVFIDENMLGVVRELDRLHPGAVYHVGHPSVPDIPPSTKDPDLLDALGAKNRNWIFITRDKKIRRRPREREHLIGAGIRAVFLSGSKDMDKKQMVELVEKHWQDIVNEVGSQPGPSLWSLTHSNGLRKLT